jgi:hypothetical protein
MSDVFPKWTNTLPLKMAVGVVLVGTAVTAGSWYYFTPKYSRVGYQPTQPVYFQHAVHAGQLGMDCRYCHSTVEKSWYANVPAANVCMNCHNAVLKDDPRLAPIRESFATGKPVPWVQIHRTPDYAYFNHSVHLARGVSCVECHGRIDQMDVVAQAKPLHMAFCLDCHRNPAMAIRPADKITDLGWTWDQNPQLAAQKQKQFGEKAIHDWKIQSLENCSACHR